jgi:hypothetical protein
MKGYNFIIIIFLIFIIASFLSVENIGAFTLITAQEAYDMLSNNQAVIIDVRTLEEYTFVGSPALEPEGDPIAFLIPWKVFKGIDEEGKKTKSHYIQSLNIKCHGLILGFSTTKVSYQAILSAGIK